MTNFSLDNHEAFIFDADDTIIDNGEYPAEGKLGLHNESRLLAARHIAEIRGLRSLLELPVQIHADAFHKSAYHSSEGAFHWLLTRAGILEQDSPFNSQDPLIIELVNTKDKYYSEMMSNVDEIPGACNFITSVHARGFDGRLAIGTTGKYNDIKAFTHSKGLMSYIPDEFIIAKGDVTNTKPDPEVFQTAAALMGIPPFAANRIGVFEDNPRGIRAARRAGMTVYALSTVYSTEQLLNVPTEDQPHYVAHDFLEYRSMFGLS